MDNINQLGMGLRSKFHQFVTAMAFIVAWTLSSHAQAVPLNLTLDNDPDIVSSFINVSYGSGMLSANGFALSLDDDGMGPAISIAGGSFDLLASINMSGILTGGTLSIGGTIGSLGFNSGTLLTGNLTDFGFVDMGGDPFEFLFNVTGGDAASLYGGTGGIILSGTGFAGSFANDFNNSPFAGMADVASVSPVPVPAAAWLFGSALIGLIGFSRRRRSISTAG